MPIKLGDAGYWVPYLMGRGSTRVRLKGMGRSSVGEVEGHGQEQYRGKFERYGQGQCTG